MDLPSSDLPPLPDGNPIVWVLIVAFIMWLVIYGP